jgi:hypothetical protein
MRRPALLLAFALLLLAAPAALAAVSITRAELNGGQVRVEGRGAVPGATITVSSPESTATGRADSGGSFRVEASSFRSSTCRVTVSDGASSAEATLSGCTPSATPSPSPTPTPTPTPSSTCTIVPETFADGNVGTLNTWFFSTTGCRTSESPVKFNVVAGRIPPGTTLFTQGQSYCCGNLFADGGVPDYTWSLRAGQLPPGLRLSASPGRITGTPTTRGTFSFLVRVTDMRGAFAERTFSITIS